MDNDDAVTDTAEYGSPEAAAKPTEVGTRIDVVSDLICPWGYIGKRQLERALELLATEGLTFSVHWNPFQINPSMPKEGRERTEYGIWKFGSPEDADEEDYRATQAAAKVGLTFRTNLMTRTPNTLAAHRLIWFAGLKNVQDAMVETLFRAYFTEGRDIGDHAVLGDCAAAVGLSRNGSMAFLATDLAEAEARSADQSAREQGMRSVPTFFLDRQMLCTTPIPPDIMAGHLRQGRIILQIYEERFKELFPS